MAIQMNITTEGLAKFRAALETGNLETLKTAKFYGGWSGGAVSGSVVATLDIAVNKAVESNSNVCRFVCQDKSDKTYTTYGGEVIDADGVIVATFNNGGEPVSTKQSKAEMMLGFEIKFEDNTAASSVINMGDTTFVFDDATETAAGIIELATEAEAKAGTDAKRAITPKTLNATSLPRKGGEMSGSIEFTNISEVLKKTDNAGELIIIGGKSWADSPYFVLRGSGNKASPGTFELVSINPNTQEAYRLVAWANGRLTWNGKNIVRSVNGKMADADGNVSIAAITNVETADKWTIARTITLSGDASGSVSIDGSANVTLVVTVKDDSHNHIIPNVDGLQDALDGKAPTVWNGKNIVRSVNGTNADAAGNVVIPLKFLPLAGGTMEGTIKFSKNEEQKVYVDDNGDLLIGGNYGGLLRIRGANSEDNPRGFQIRAGEADGVNMYLIGKPDGTLTWDGKELLRVVDSWKSGDNWYRKYSDGFIEQGGILPEKNYETITSVSLNTPFTTTSYYVGMTPKKDSQVAAGANAGLHTLNTSSFTFDIAVSATYAYHWYACGY